MQSSNSPRFERSEPGVPSAHAAMVASPVTMSTRCRCPLPYIPPMCNKALVGLVSGLLLVLTGCSSDGPSLTYGHMSQVTEGEPRVHQGDTVSIGSMFACLDKAGTVTVTNISPINATGMKVTGWAVRPNPFWIAPDRAPHVGDRSVWNT